MIALGMVMCQVLLDHRGQRSFAEHKHAIEGFFFDGPDEPFAVGVQIRAPGRQDERFYIAALEQAIEHLGEFGVPIVDEISFPEEEVHDQASGLRTLRVHDRSALTCPRPCPLAYPLQ